MDRLVVSKAWHPRHRHIGGVEGSDDPILPIDGMGALDQRAKRPGPHHIGSVRRGELVGRIRLSARKTVDVDGRLKTLDMPRQPARERRSEENTSEIQSLMRISYAVFCLK